MKIAIIGAGTYGGAFAAAAVKAGHEVTVSARHLENAEKTAADTGATAVPRSRAEVGADVVVLAIPGTAVAAWADEQGRRLDGAVVVDATNPLKPDYSDTFTVGRSSAEDLQDRLPGARVVKGFNTVFAARLGHADEGGVPLDALLAGDDTNAKATVADLARSLGFGPRDAGGLRLARALEEIAFLHIGLAAGNNWVWQSAVQIVGPTTGR